jgi:hypothetical protein
MTPGERDRSVTFAIIAGHPHPAMLYTVDIDMDTAGGQVRSEQMDV